MNSKSGVRTVHYPFDFDAESNVAGGHQGEGTRQFDQF
jgi:hypothetical protein